MLLSRPRFNLCLRALRLTMVKGRNTMRTLSFSSTAEWVVGACLLLVLVATILS